MKLFSTSHFILFSSHVSQHSRTLGVKRGWRLEHEIPLYLEPSDAREWACLNMLDLGVLGFYFKAWGSSNQHLRIEYLIFNLKVYFLKWYVCILLGMYIVAFSIGFLFWKSCKSWRRLGALDYIWKSGVGFTLFYFTDLFVEILGRKGSGTMIFIVSWCYGGLAMVVFILFWQGSYPPWWHHTGILCIDGIETSSMPPFPWEVTFASVQKPALCAEHHSVTNPPCFFRQKWHRSRPWYVELGPGRFPSNLLSHGRFRKCCLLKGGNLL